MPFDRGSVTCTIFSLPEKLPEDYLESFHARRAGKLDDVEDEPQIGWVTGRYLLESNINEETAMCGGHLHLNLRKAERKIPGALLTAICKREELVWMAANNMSKIPAKVKKEIREDQVERHLMKMPPHISGVPFVIDTMSNTLYLGTASPTQIDDFIALFNQTVGIEPIQMTLEELMYRHYQKDCRELPDIRFSPDALDDDAMHVRNFMTWLWFFSETTGGKLEEEGSFGDVELLVEGPLTLSFFTETQGASETVVKKGLPQKSAEVKAALSVGKKLRKAKITFARGEEIWTGTFDADRFAFSGLKLPDGEKMDEHSKFAERIQNLYVFQEIIQAYFKAYADCAMSPDWEQKEKEIQAWATERESY